LLVRLAEKERVYAAGRLLFEGGKFVATDRLGSAVYKFSQGLALVNGGMETGVSPWYAYYGAQAEVSYVPHTGGRSLRVTTPIVDRGVYQEVKNLVAGMSYQFQAWVRAESGTSLAALAVAEAIRARGSRPERVLATDEQLARGLEELAMALGFEVRLKSHLPVLDEFFRVIEKKARADAAKGPQRVM